MIIRRTPRSISLAAFALPLVLALAIPYWLGSSAYGSELITHELDSPSIAKNTIGISSLRKFEVYLPDGYAESKLCYPVLYWLPAWSGGLNGGQYKPALDDAIQTDVIPPTIAVFVDGYDRFMEGILFLNSAMFGNWGNFLISELIPFVDREYRTIPNMVGRGLMGASAGGYSTLILPLLHPDVWGAIGTNDACLQWACGSAGWPEGDILDEYPKASLSLKGQIQIGASISPNPDAAIGLDWPREPDIREKWNAYCLNNRKTISQNEETFSNLLEIAVVVPEGSSPCRGDNLTMIRLMEAEGISVTQLDSPGGHGDSRDERFISIAERILKAMEGAEVSVSPREKVAGLWGETKQSQTDLADPD